MEWCGEVVRIPDAYTEGCTILAIWMTATDIHHHHRVARPWQDIAVSMSLRHLERSCARFHAELRPRLCCWRSSSIVRSHAHRHRKPDVKAEMLQPCRTARRDCLDVYVQRCNRGARVLYLAKPTSVYYTVSGCCRQSLTLAPSLPPLQESGAGRGLCLGSRTTKPDQTPALFIHARWCTAPLFRAVYVDVHATNKRAYSKYSASRRSD